MKNFYPGDLIFGRYNLYLCVGIVQNNNDDPDRIMSPFMLIYLHNGKFETVDSNTKGTIENEDEKYWTVISLQ